LLQWLSGDKYQILEERVGFTMAQWHTLLGWKGDNRNTEKKRQRPLLPGLRATFLRDEGFSSRINLSFLAYNYPTPLPMNPMRNKYDAEVSALSEDIS